MDSVALATDGSGSAYEVRLRGPRVELVIHPPQPEAPPLDRRDVFAGALDAPVESCSTERILAALKRLDGAPVEIGEVVPVTSPSGWEVRVSPNRMVAYLVPALEPPGAVVPVSCDELRAQITALSITEGLDDAVLASFDPDGAVACITPIARATRPVPGTDARIEMLFESSPLVAHVERAGGRMDYHEATEIPRVEPGTVLARYHAPVAGTPGVDLFGHPIPVAPPSDRALPTIAGKGTEVRDDTLVATVPGRPVLISGKVEVLVVFEVKGDIDYAIGNVNFNGDVIVAGDIHPGFSVRATGSVTVRGVIDHASVWAGRDLIAGGIVGDGTTTVHAGGGLTAQYVHNVRLTADGAITVNRELVGSIASAGKVATSGNGRIVGGEVIAVSEVSAGTLGSLQGVPTTVVVTGSPEVIPVVRAAKAVNAGVIIRVGHCAVHVNDDLPASSFWEFEGELSRLGPAAASPKLA